MMQGNTIPSMSALFIAWNGFGRTTFGGYVHIILVVTIKHNYFNT